MDDQLSEAMKKAGWDMVNKPEIQDDISVPRNDVIKVMQAAGWDIDDLVKDNKEKAILPEITQNPQIDESNKKIESIDKKILPIDEIATAPADIHKVASGIKELLKKTATESASYENQDLYNKMLYR